jgi:biopolymer transport protein ExbD
LPITFYCTECTQKLRIDDDFAGKLVACTRCRARLRVPLTSQAARTTPAAKPQAQLGGQLEQAEGRTPQREVTAPREELAALKPQVHSAGEFKSMGAAAPRTKLKPAREEPLLRPAMKIDFEELIDMTAMVDIVFFLLIFFLVTSMKAIDSTVPMPAPDPQKSAARESRSIPELESDTDYIIVHIDRNDRITVNDAEVHSDRDLLFRLRDLRTSGNRPDKMLVVGHGEATHGTAVMVLDTGREVGIEQVRLAVADESE